MLSANERRLKLKIGIRIFCKKSSNFVQKEPQIETSESEREKDRCATGAEEGKKWRRSATNRNGAGRLKRADLSRTQNIL